MTIGIKKQNISTVTCSSTNIAFLTFNTRWLSKLSLRIMTITVVSTVMLSPLLAHAANPLSDDELDSRYLDVPVHAPNLTNTTTQDTAPQDATSSSTSTAKSKAGPTIFDKVQSMLVQSSSSLETNLILIGVDQSLRDLQSTELVGVPAGVADTGVPPLFGNENYSTRWAGNLNEVYVVPANNIDELKTIYGNDYTFYVTPNYQPPTIEVTARKD